MPTTVSLTKSDFVLLCEVIDSVARRSGLPPDEAADFSQTAHLKFLERNYGQIALFSGRSSLRTYLTVVVRRLLLDWRNGQYGKWRPSSTARRLGSAAVELDRLIHRDGHPSEEAIAILSDRPSAPNPGALRMMAGRLPYRNRLRTVTMDHLEDLSVEGFKDPIETEQAETWRRHKLRALRRAVLQLQPDDQRLLYFRFGRNLSVPAIAALIDMPAKPLYRRLNTLFETIRREMNTVQHCQGKVVAGRVAR